MSRAVTLWSKNKRQVGFISCHILLILEMFLRTTFNIERIFTDKNHLIKAQLKSHLVLHLCINTKANCIQLKTCISQTSVVSIHNKCYMTSICAASHSKLEQKLTQHGSARHGSGRQPSTLQSCKSCCQLDRVRNVFFKWFPFHYSFNRHSALITLVE